MYVSFVCVALRCVTLYIALGMNLGTWWHVTDYNNNNNQEEEEEEEDEDEE